MKLAGLALLMTASLCWAQESGDFIPSSMNVWGAEYPRVDSTGRVQIRVKAADAAAFAKKVHVLWLGVGTQEPERMRSGLLKLHTSLQDANIPHIFYESPGTDHEWQTWRRDLKDFAPRLFQ